MNKKAPEIPTFSTGVALGAWALPAGNSLPPISPLTPEQMAELLQHLAPQIAELENLGRGCSCHRHYDCEACRDTKIISVYGGPDRPCPYCGDRY